MKSLYNQQDNAELIARICRLNHAALAHWGTMDVSQMLAHCQVPLKISFNELEARRGISGLLFGRMTKNVLLKDRPFDKNQPTYKQARIKGRRDFHKERELLITYLARVATNGPDGITQKPHPFFGYLTTEEWDCIHYKHLDHHLKQFGV